MKAVANLRKMPMAKTVTVVVWKLIAKYHEDPCTRKKSFSRTLLSYLLIVSHSFVVKCDISALLEMSISMHMTLITHNQ